MMYRLERHEYTSSDLILHFYYSGLTSNKIGVYYFIEKDGVYENVKTTTVDVIPGDSEHMAEVILSGLESGTEYTVRMCPINAEGEFYIEDFLVEGKFYTDESYDAPKFKRFSVKVENGKINCDFEIGNLNSEKETDTRAWGCDVFLQIDGKQVGHWYGDSLSDKSEILDGGGYIIERGTLTVHEEYDFPEAAETCVVRVEASNFCINKVSGNDVYEEITFRETEISLSFSWDIAKVTGENIRLSAAEWNRFIDKLKKRLQSKGIQYSKAFTTAVSGGLVGRNVGTAADGLSIDSPKVISKSILCEAVDALNAMLSEDEKISYPTGISASFLNNIVDKLNSI